eukprot:c5847_g1_i1 orf=3-218(-)
MPLCLPLIVTCCSPRSGLFFPIPPLHFALPVEVCFSSFPVGLFNQKNYVCIVKNGFSRPLLHLPHFNTHTHT